MMMMMMMMIFSLKNIMFFAPTYALREADTIIGAEAYDLPQTVLYEIDAFTNPRSQ